MSAFKSTFGGAMGCFFAFVFIIAAGLFILVGCPLAITTYHGIQKQRELKQQKDAEQPPVVDDVPAPEAPQRP